MCQLLSLIFTRPVPLDLSWREFRHRGASNPDGWGLAWYDQATRSWQVEKDTVALHKSARGASLLSHPPGPASVYLAHVRQATSGSVTQENCHPFLHPFRGRSVVLAHNGTLKNLPPSRRDRQGSTDSEHLLCLLLDRLEDEGVAFEDEVGMKRILRDLTQYGPLNTIFTDGTTLYAYRDQQGRRPLYRMRRMFPFGKITLKKENLVFDLSDQKTPDTSGHILASEPLTDEAWEEIPPGQLARYTLISLRP